MELHVRGETSLRGAPNDLAFDSPLLPVCVADARGARIIDIDGNEYIDCHMAYSAAILGHRPPATIAAIQEAVARGVGAGYFVADQLTLAEQVKAMVPGADAVAMFHSGSDAIAAALRLARAMTGRTMVAKFDGCYHGWTEVGIFNSMPLLSGRERLLSPARISPEAHTSGVTLGAGSDLLVLPYGMPVAINEIHRHGKDLAAVLIDPVPPFMDTKPDLAGEFLHAVRLATSRQKVPLILDEVVTGFRLARGGAQEAFGVDAELACFGKVTSGCGVPLALVAGSSEFLDLLKTDGFLADHRSTKVWASTTTIANHVAVAAGLAQLRYIAEHFEAIAAHLDSNYESLNKSLADFRKTSGIPVRLFGHPRLRSMVVLDQNPRDPSAGLSTLLALTLYLREEGVYAQSFPTMNLSAAHTSEDVTDVALAIGRSLTRMQADGVLEGETVS